MTDSPRRTDAELVAACANVNDDCFEEAFEELYRRYRDRVYSIAFRMSGSTQDALDVTQDAFRTLFLKIGSFRFDAQFSTWLFRIVVNCSIDHRRREAARQAKRGVSLSLLDPVAEPTSDSQGPDSAAETHETGAQVHEALLRLSPKLRAVLVLRYLEGLSYEELATALEIQIGTVKSRLARAHVAIEEVLRGSMEELGFRPTDDDEEGVA